MECGTNSNLEKNNLCTKIRRSVCPPTLYMDLDVNRETYCVFDSLVELWVQCRSQSRPND